MKKMSPLINAGELASLMTDENLVLIDARTGPEVKERYQSQHLNGALFVDLETELSKKEDPAKGGRHPLPPIEDFAALIGRLGIDPLSHVVVYDDKSGANAAARFWWMMKSIGHEKVQLLDGGLKAAIDEGLPTSNEISGGSAKGDYPVEKWMLPTADADAVAKTAADSSSLVIDVREAYRYDGESEPIDTVAGHIPGAVNIPYTGNLDAAGKFLSPAELAEKYRSALKDKKPEQVVVHCGSGVTACHTLLAMELAGLEIPNLYVGSWSEWSRNDRPVAKGE